MKGEDIKNLAIGAAILGGLYLVYRALSAAPKLFAAPGALGTSIGTALYDWINPNPFGESVFYTVTFQDGSTHAVPGSTVDASGNFTFQGANYVMKLGADNRHYAVAAVPSLPAF